jgi:hypothetical protein
MVLRLRRRHDLFRATSKAGKSSRGRATNSIYRRLVFYNGIYGLWFDPHYSWPYITI